MQLIAVPMIYLRLSFQAFCGVTVVSLILFLGIAVWRDRKNVFKKYCYAVKQLVKGDFPTILFRLLVLAQAIYVSCCYLVNDDDAFYVASAQTSLDTDTMYVFDPYTGEYLHSLGGQGYGHGSSWTRGQAWAIYGFALSFRHTKEKRYLDTAVKVADYFISCIPQSGLIPVDFCQPKEPAYEDSTAAAIAACGLLEIAGHLKEAGDKYKEAALQLLKALYDCRVNWDENADQLLEKCTAAYHDKEHEFTIIYGDYYFIEAIWKLMGKELPIW